MPRGFALALLLALAAVPGATALAVGVGLDGPAPVRATASPEGGLDASVGPDGAVAEVHAGLDGAAVDSGALALPVVEVATPLAADEAAGDGPAPTAAERLADAAGEAAAPAAAAGAGAVLLALLWRALSFGASALPFASRLFSRIEGPRVLDNAARARLNELVAATPGATLEELRAAAGIAWGTAVHHLRRLEAHGLVVSHASGARHRYFPANTQASRHRAALAALAQPTAQRIARLVQASPGIGQQDVCAELGLNAPAASKHLGRFASQGLVSVRADGRRRLYEPTPELKAALAIAVA